MITHLALLAALAFVSGCGFSYFSVGGAGDAAISPVETAGGTYEFWICRGSCSSPSDTSVFASGRFVIFVDTISRRELEAAPIIAGRIEYHPGARACFVFLMQRETDVRSYAGMEPGGWTSWGQGSPAQLNIRLFASPDAFYRAELVKRGEVWLGVGKSLGYGAVVGAGFSADSVRARRVGPADLSECTRVPAPRRPMY